MGNQFLDDQSGHVVTHDDEHSYIFFQTLSKPNTITWLQHSAMGNVTFMHSQSDIICNMNFVNVSRNMIYLHVWDMLWYLCIDIWDIWWQICRWPELINLTVFAKHCVTRPLVPDMKAEKPYCYQFCYGNSGSQPDKVFFRELDVIIITIVHVLMIKLISLFRAIRNIWIYSFQQIENTMTLEWYKRYL